ncbi:hypothetical protein PSA7680_01157 [Pseudoruegeria aquimaris]|uniref:VWFA domain-containing protein n=1 Tax=Pseudoruegeria aquimaris TaxID=393663 RepID=A0A1Y5RZF1_9RHOB|nr:DUF1194 domain-containing protein [Pseudoruegeria aquimaris]SLN26467.1 hypothetical protein PSA7680_01157 [Pseudoruegeria aquimaris]
MSRRAPSAPAVLAGALLLGAAPLAAPASAQATATPAQSAQAIPALPLKARAAQTQASKTQATNTQFNGCRQALALGLDVSGSVDATEYAIQRRGLAGALRHPEVRAALLQLPGLPVSLMVFEWSGADAQHDLTGWRSIRTEADIETLATELANPDGRPAAGTTAIGSAIQFAVAAFEAGPRCFRRTLDLSGDGKNNGWPPPRDTHALAAAAGVGINGLVIGGDSPSTRDDRSASIGELVAYFQHNVILGPGAFVEAALGFEDFEAAMVRKLLKELDGFVFGALPAAGRKDTAHQAFHLPVSGPAPSRSPAEAPAR